MSWDTRHPGFGDQVPGRPSSSPSKPWAPLLAVLGAVLAVGFLVVAMSQQDGDGPPALAGLDAGDEEGAGGGPVVDGWTVPAADGADRGQVIRVLPTGDDLVIVSERAVTAIDRRTGEEGWQTHLEQFDADGQLLVLCGAATAPTGDGRLPVTAGFADDVDNIDGQTSYAPACSQVGLLDLATGELGPLTEVEGTYDEEAPASAQDGMAVEVLGDTVMVAWSSTVVGLNPSDLSEGWRWTPESRRGADSSCIILDLAPTGPDQAVLLSACIPADSLDLVDDYFLDELSVTGQVSRSRQITAEEAEVEMDELAGVELISAAPLVVEVSRAPGGGDADGDRSLLAFDDSWELQNAIHDERTTRSADENLYTEPVGYLTRSGPWRRPNRTLVSGGTLVSFTTPEGEANELVAVDLRTGENVWTAPTEPGHLVWQVLAVDDETAIAVVREDGGPGQSIMYVDMATGDVQDTRTTEVPSPDGGSSDTVDPARFGYVFADDRAYGVDFNLRPGDEAASWLAFTVG